MSLHLFCVSTLAFITIWSAHKGTNFQALLLKKRCDCTSADGVQSKKKERKKGFSRARQGCPSVYHALQVIMGMHHTPKNPQNQTCTQWRNATHACGLFIKELLPVMCQFCATHPVVRDALAESATSVAAAHLSRSLSSTCLDPAKGLLATNFKSPTRPPPGIGDMYTASAVKLVRPCQ